MTNPQPILSPPGEQSGTYTTDDIAALLKCSPRHVRRLDDRRLIPGRIAAGRLVRFACKLVDQWILDGCPAPNGGRR
jgi:excisionase family DNA binding protein